MPSPQAPPSPEMDHDGSMGLTWAESLAKSLRHIKEQAAYKEFEAIFQLNNDLKERNAKLKLALDACDKTNTRIVDKVKAAEGERNETQSALEKLKQNRDKDLVDLKKAHEEVAKLRTEITATKEAITKTFQSKQVTEQQLDKKTQENNAKVEELKRQGEILKETRQRLEGLQREYDQDHAELADFRGKSAPLIELQRPQRRVLGELIRSIFENAHDLVYRFFGQSELERHVFDSESWKKLEDDKRFNSIPLVASNSEVATHMRVAKALHILAVFASENLFQPVYLTECGTEISTFIENLYVTKPQHAQWVRSVLLKTEPEVQLENAQKRMETVVDEVMQLVGFLLSSVDQGNQFATALMQWCEESTRAWRELQHFTVAFQCFFESKPRDINAQEWTVLPISPANRRQAADTNGGPSPGEPEQEMGQPDIAAQVWPVVIATRNDGRAHVATKGYMLTELQVNTAREEKASTRTLSRNRRNSRKQARVSRIPPTSNDNF